MWHEYPYTDAHELNLDWFLKEFKELMDNWETLSADNKEFKQTMTGNFNTLEGTVQNFINFVNNYFNNLDVQQEINNKLDAMAADGTLIELIQPYYDQIVASQNQRIGTLETTATSLQNQINEIVAPDPDPSLAEVAAARVALDGTAYPTLKAHLDADETNFNTLKSQYEFDIQTNNLLRLEDYTTTYHGVTFTVKNGIITLSGTADAHIRVKLTNGYVFRNQSADSWTLQRCTQFEIGHTYSLKNVIISGTKADGVGVSLRGLTGESVVSLTNEEVALTDEITYAMLYIPIDTTVNFSYVPVFYEGLLTDQAYYRRVNPIVEVPGVNNKYEHPDLTLSYIYDSTLEYAIKLPSTYADTGKKTPLIILCHGLSSTLDGDHWGNNDMLPLVNKFVADGYAVLDVNQVTTQDWINPALIHKYLNAVKDACNRYYIEPTIIYGESMGGLIALCLSTLYDIKACAIAGLRLDFEARYNNLTDAQKLIVDANLDFTDGYHASKITGWDKTVYPAVNNGDKICSSQFPPTIFIVGDEDTYNTESLIKVNEIKRGGTITSVNTYEGNHNAVCYLKVGTSYDDVIAWYTQYR